MSGCEEARATLRPPAPEVSLGGDPQKSLSSSSLALRASGETWLPCREWMKELPTRFPERPWGLSRLLCGSLQNLSYLLSPGPPGNHSLSPSSHPFSRVGFGINSHSRGSATLWWTALRPPAVALGTPPSQCAPLWPAS